MPPEWLRTLRRRDMRWAGDRRSTDLRLEAPFACMLSCTCMQLPKVHLGLLDLSGFLTFQRTSADTVVSSILVGCLTCYHQQ